MERFLGVGKRVGIRFFLLTNGKNGVTIKRSKRFRKT
jgi:hypothetical protein